MIDHYAQYHRLAKRLHAALSACDHDQRDYETNFQGNGGRVSYCRSCSDENRTLHNAMRAAYTSARKRQLADMPRCEFCKRRGTIKAGQAYPSAGMTAALVCGRHFKIAQREQARTTGISLFVAVSGDMVRAMIREAVQV